MESLRGAFTDRCPVFTCQLYLFTCQVSEFFDAMSVFKYAGSRHRMEKKIFHRVSLVKRTAGETSKKVVVCGFPQMPHFTVLGALNGS